MAAIHVWFWLIEALGVVIVRHVAILVQWRVVNLLKGGSEGKPTNLDCNVLFCGSI